MQIRYTSVRHNQIFVYALTTKNRISATAESYLETKPFAISKKSSIVDVLLGSEYS